MDVNASNFEAHWPTLARHISRSTYVAIDLELSGIPMRNTGHGEASDCQPSKQQTLQERYQANKSAAEHYTIVQIGLTFVEEDLTRGVYIARPYNFCVNPVLDPNYGIQRDVNFSSESSEFLLKHGFDMKAPFTNGIPYLSRLEESAIRQHFDILINLGETATFAGEFGRQEYEDIGLFSHFAFQAIKSWNSQNLPFTEQLEIYSHRGNGPRDIRARLTPLEIQIIHQIIHAHHDDLLSRTASGIVRISRQNSTTRTAPSVTYIPEQLKADVVQAKGLRWIFEALCPQVDNVLPITLKEPFATGSLSQTMAWVTPYLRVSGTVPERISGDFASLMHDIKQHETALVGHNMFMDLIYLCQNFWGPLPDTVEDFARIIEPIFPMVFDTKFLGDARFKFTDGCMSSSLQDLDRRFSKNTAPVIEIPPAFDKYEGNEMAHEAGFDSLVTARVFLRMMCELNPHRHVFVPAGSNTHGAVSAHETCDCDSRINSSEEQSTTALEAHPNVHPDDPASESQSQEGSSKGSWRVMVPDPGNEVWTNFGWKLRVNGTVEGVCHI